MDNYHQSVLFDEVVEGLKVVEGKRYIDGTLGGGGHAIEIAKRGGHVLAIDVDEDAIAHVALKIKHEESGVRNNIKIVLANFKDIGEVARENGFDAVEGILFDLGVSSHQLDTAERGFSFVKGGPLDMRLGKTLSVSAKDLVNGLTRDELVLLFTKFGEEPFAQKIARAIVEERIKRPIETTDELARIVAKVVRGNKGVHPATRVFQALRIAINDELHNLEVALSVSLPLLQPGGRIVVISFHSLEDRIVKHTFRSWEEMGKGVQTTKKPITPSAKEILGNPRSRSAKMRIFSKN